MSREATKLVLGRGEVYFDRFLPGTRRGEGERYLGNTTSFRIQREVERLKRATSYRGRRIATAGAVIAESHEVNFTTDNVDDENVALWFGGSVPTPSGGPVNEISETFPVLQGRFYQLGKTLSPIVGVRNVAYVSVRRGGTPVRMTGNYEVDPGHGRIEILDGAPDIPDGTAITVSFQVAASDEVMLNGEPDGVYGALRFVSFNKSPGGISVQNDLYFPYVRITPRGQVELKSDEWQQWTFDAEVMNLSPAHSQVYVTRGATTVSISPDERAIYDELGDLVPFPMWEDELHVVTNEEWPPALVIPPIL
ncbi:phage tail tube protein [Aquamicrobium zhengzhouense]|uniref:Minor tail protein n=1 Tax=Aquamicrobium zhengzhouense TaxID=2781738 RepID=A0ABS0S9X0_9HYPH|nr:hypothetical protein [Aquamicrobium zhengzhouense]MBI1620026.1 hypothetical protein [Aquamicrobium zhengzhouense]